MPIKTIIMGAAGRDFHNFNTFFRGNKDYEVVAFTATQIPDIEGTPLSDRTGWFVIPKRNPHPGRGGVHRPDPATWRGASHLCLQRCTA